MNKINASKEIIDAYGIFHEYSPCLTGQENYSLKRWQGIIPRFRRYPIQDLNSNKGNTTLIQYTLKHNGEKINVPIFTVDDFIRLTGYDPYDEENKLRFEESNVVGFLKEKIAWTTTYFWLSRIMDKGHLIETPYEEEHIYANSESDILKVKNSPNLFLLTKKNEDYELIKEIDGIFLYEEEEHGRHVIIQETKTNGFSIGLENLVENLFNPVKRIFPDSKILYLLFDDMNSIYSGGEDEKERKSSYCRIKSEPIRIFNTLLKENIGTMFFGFRESRRVFRDSYVFLEDQLAILNKEEVTLSAKYDPRGSIKLLLGNMPIEILYRKNQNTWVSYPPKNKKNP